MTIHLLPRHTRVVETVVTAFGTLVREDYRHYPNEESNLYLVDSANTVLWFAQRAMPDDSYANPIVVLGNDKVRCYSAKGIECDIDLKTGRLLNAEVVR